METDARWRSDFSGESSLNIRYYKDVDMSNEYCLETQHLESDKAYKK